MYLFTSENVCNPNETISFEFDTNENLLKNELIEKYISLPGFVKFNFENSKLIMIYETTGVIHEYVIGKITSQ